MSQPHASTLHQTLIGLGAIVVAAAMAWGAASIPSVAGYAGIGPNVVPWAVAVVLAVCGAWLVWQARTGGWRDMETPSGAERGDWGAFAWVSAGVLANAALITTIGFVLACTLCYALAVRGLRSAEGRPAGNARQTVIDAVTGVLIAAPVYWLFTKLLAINLPGVSGTGWI
ncbi:MAG TPA: tripartite tricarboxylate transporter TctB family protein [Albitalea sp.]